MRKPTARTRAVLACFASGGVVLALGLAGCGDIIGLGDYTDNDGAIVVDSGGGDAAKDAPTDAKNDVGDAGGDAPAEGGCNGFSVCVPQLPNGWSWAIYDQDTRVTCANGYTTPTDVEEGLDAGPAVCTCGCAVNAPDCASGNLTITAGTNGACNNITSQTDIADAGCNGLTQFSTNGAGISVTAPAPVGGSCTPSPSQTLPPVGYTHQGRTCAYTGSTDGGCSTGNVCVPNPSPFAMCISRSGSVACPSGFPNQHLVGSALSDTRGCSSCGCTFNVGTCQGTATFYTNGACNTGNTPITADGNCHVVNGNRTWRGYSYSATSSASCTGSAVSADGGVAFSDLSTVCCM